MVEEIQTINVKEIGEEIAQECFNEYQNDLSIDNITEEIQYFVHDTIKADILYFAEKYLAKKNINC